MIPRILIGPLQVKTRLDCWKESLSYCVKQSIELLSGRIAEVY